MLLNVNTYVINVFKKELLKFIRSEPNSIYNIHDTKGLKLLTRLRLVRSYLGDHKFRHIFKRLFITSVLLWSGLRNNNSLLPSMPQSSLCKENSFSQDNSSKWNHLKTE